MARRDQAPVGSGFAAKTDAADVVADIDLSGKRAVVTGGYSGIGLETAKALAGAGAEVIVPARRPDVAKEALVDVPRATVAAMDLGDLSSVRAFADDVLAGGEPLHILINNAGIMACPEARVGPGWESQFGINHLGHFELSRRLHPALEKADGARLVALSSTAHIRGDVQWDDPNYETTPYEKWGAYAQAKSANALFARGADMRWQSDGITAFSVHPGGILTPLQRHLPREEMVALGWLNPDGTMQDAVKAMFKTPQQGASTSVWAATSAKLDGRGGVYCEDCDIAKPAGEDSQRWEHARPWIFDDEKAERLWGVSEQMIADA
ncbi:MAG: oxidoreductase [Pseudomonadota bacterium]